MTDPRHDGGDLDARGQFNPEDQAEYDRLEALEAEHLKEQATEGEDVPDDGTRTADLTQDPDRHGDVPEPVDPDVDTAAGIDTEAEEASREVRTHATPWGLRPMSLAEAADLRAQGLAITEEPDLEPDTSLEGERADLASLPAVVATEHRDTETEDFDSNPDNFDTDPDTGKRV